MTQDIEALARRLERTHERPYSRTSVVTGMIQISTTATTHVYVNPDGPEAAAALRAQAAEIERGGWQDISTAPMDADGLPFLVCDAKTSDGFMQVVYFEPANGPDLVTADGYRYEAKEWCFATNDGPTFHPDTFTHWQPLPKAPMP